MRKSFVVIMTTGLVLTASGVALAINDIPPTTYTPAGHNGADKDYQYYEQGSAVSSGSYSGSTPTGAYATSTHKYGTWNSPYTEGVDGYNYNDAQDYVGGGDMVSGKFQSGPHGGYATSTHRCRECHAVHRAAGKFKLLRSDTRYEACDWCHGTGAGSGFNIQMDNDDGYTTEYNVGHTMGFGIESGKWKAPDDTYPAYTPNYWQGGFSCFDCHSPHANPQRLLGYNDGGTAVGIADNGKTYSIANPGHSDMGANDNCLHAGTDNKEPIYLAGSWLLIKNPDRELASFSESATVYNIDTDATETVSVISGQEISDLYYARSEVNEGVSQVTSGLLDQFDGVEGGAGYPVNKLPIDWDSPVGPAGSSNASAGFDDRVMTKRIWNVSEFCTDCHDGNAGLHTVQAPLFSEDRALRDQGGTHEDSQTPSWKGNYDLAYSHDAQPRH